MDSLNMRFQVQIFATDLNSEAIETARLGNYPESISADVPSEFLERYFTKEVGLYCIKKDIRDMAVFALQNMITDPPFSRMALVTCRNLLIYFDAELQKKGALTIPLRIEPAGLSIPRSLGEHRRVHRLFFPY